MDGPQWVSVCGLCPGFCLLVSRCCTRTIRFGVQNDDFEDCAYFMGTHPSTGETYKQFRSNRWKRKPARPRLRKVG